MRTLSRLTFALLCTGCGAVKEGQLPDAPPTPEIDASVVDAAPTAGLVKVTVLDPGGSGAPAVGATAVFLNPDDSVVKRAATDSAGKAEAEVMIGASVTSIVLVGSTYQIQTVLGVKPGDEIVLGTRNNDNTSAGSMTVTFPTLIGTTFYEVTGPCGSSRFDPPVGPPPPTVSQVLTFQAHCKVSPMEIVVSAFDSADMVLQSVHKPGVVFVDGGAVAMPAYDGVRPFTGSYTNIDAIIVNASMTRAVPDGTGRSIAGVEQTTGATRMFSLTGPKATTARIDSSFSIASRSFQRVRQTLAGTAATYGLDVGATLLPWLSGAPTFDPAAGKVTVPTDNTGTSGAKPDAFRLTATYERTDDGSKVTTTFRWTVFAEAPIDIKFPALPTDLGALTPLATDTFFPMTATMFEADTVAGYDEARADLNRAFTLFGGPRYPATTVRNSSSPSFRVF